MRADLMRICTGLLLAVSARAGAQSADAPLLPEVVTSATRAERDGFELPVAIDSVDKTVIQEDNLQVNLSEALNRVPGIVVQNRYNYAQDLQISSRGFGARSTFGVRGIRLIADGIPATMPDGQGQAATFNLSSAQRIEVMRGPFASLYGNAAGGVISVITADGPREPTLSGTFNAGSYGTRKAGVQFGGEQTVGEGRNLNYLIDVSRFDQDGYREHSAVTRDQLNAKLKLPLSAGRLTLVANALDQPETQDPLGLTRAQAIANPRQADAVATAFNTRKSVRHRQLGLVYDLDLGNTRSVQARVYAGDRQVTQYLGFAGSAPLSSGGVVDLDRGFGGFGLRWTQRLLDADAPLTLTAGIDRDSMDEHRRGYVNNAGVRGALQRDEDDKVSNTDAYAQLEWKVLPRLSVSGGLRHSRVRFDSSDRYITAANPDDSGDVRYTKTTPVAGIVFNLLPQWNVYANAGRGFETPTFAELAYRPGGATGLNFALRPATSLHREVGVKGRVGGSSRVNLALFRIDTENEIVVNGAAGGRTDFKNASRTQREGWELSWESYLGAGFEAYLAYTRLNARFTEPFTAGATTVLAGNKLPGVPSSTLYGELVWRHAASGFHAGIELRANGKVYVNDANTEAAGGYAIGNLRAGFEQRGKRWRLSEFVRVDNASDRRYMGSVIVADANGRYYEPAPGRNYLVGVNAAVGF